jgi:predicted ATP-grasp superfamily ATP-dependent carboligase
MPYFRDHPFLVQEYVPGTGAGIFALYNRGEAVTFFAHKRLREKPPTGGVSVLSESVPLDPRLVDMARRLLDHAHWHGVAMVEFRVTPEGEPYLMEVNPRFWGSLQLAIDCGIDFPRLLFEMGRGETPRSPADYPAGRRLRWLLGDLDSLYLTLRNGRDFTKAERLRRILAFLNPGFGSTRYEINRLGDLGPARFELRAYLRHLLRPNHPQRETAGA